MKPTIGVTDHACLRWMERAYNLDIPALRRRLAEKVERAIAQRDRIDKDGRVVVVVDGMRFVVEGRTIVTVTPARGR